MVSRLRAAALAAAGVLAAIVVLSWAATREATARSNGAPFGHTQPGFTCTECHGSYAGTIITASGLSIPDTITGGSEISVTAFITGYTDITGTFGVGGGFQVAASAGRLYPGLFNKQITNLTPSSRTVRNELTHIGGDRTEWAFTWRPPECGGRATLYAAILLNNGNRATSGDSMALVSRTVTVTNAVGVSCLSVPMGSAGAASP
jgi:hypothetical protein